MGEHRECPAKAGSLEHRLWESSALLPVSPGVGLHEHHVALALEVGPFIELCTRPGVDVFRKCPAPTLWLHV